MKLLIRVGMFISLVISLISCGGGGGGSSTNITDVKEIEVPENLKDLLISNESSDDKFKDIYLLIQIGKSGSDNWDYKLKLPAKQALNDVFADNTSFLYVYALKSEGHINRGVDHNCGSIYPLSKIEDGYIPLSITKVDADIHSDYELDFSLKSADCFPDSDNDSFSNIEELFYEKNGFGHDYNEYKIPADISNFSLYSVRNRFNNIMGFYSSNGTNTLIACRDNGGSLELMALTENEEEEFDSDFEANLQIFPGYYGGSVQKCGSDYLHDSKNETYLSVFLNGQYTMKYILNYSEDRVEASDGEFSGWDSLPYSIKEGWSILPVSVLRADSSDSDIHIYETSSSIFTAGLTFGENNLYSIKSYNKKDMYTGREFVTEDDLPFYYNGLASNIATDFDGDFIYFIVRNNRSGYYHFEYDGYDFVLACNEEKCKSIGLLSTSNGRGVTKNILIHENLKGKFLRVNHLELNNKYIDIPIVSFENSNDFSTERLDSKADLRSDLTNKIKSTSCTAYSEELNESMACLFSIFRSSTDNIKFEAYKLIESDSIGGVSIDTVYKTQPKNSENLIREYAANDIGSFVGVQFDNDSKEISMLTLNAKDMIDAPESIPASLNFTAVRSLDFKDDFLVSSIEVDLLENNHITVVLKSDTDKDYLIRFR